MNNDSKLGNRIILDKSESILNDQVCLSSFNPLLLDLLWDSIAYPFCESLHSLFIKLLYGSISKDFEERF